MNIDPVYTSIGVLFKRQSTFFIPKYQRSYAWDSESVEDFIKDLTECFNKRKQNKEINHFFGGILSVKNAVAGTFDQHSYEIIDGQQRIATFILLVACLIKSYQALQGEAQQPENSENLLIIQRRYQGLYERFIEFEQEKQRKFEPVEVVTLSKADHPYYRDLIRDLQPETLRDSHKKIHSAYQKIEETLRGIIDSSDTLENKIDDLGVIEKVLDNDFTILHMVTDKKEDAFRLFQVINDRGTNLTDGDLLRAKTLEMLEDFKKEQRVVEELWDNILADCPSDTSDYLNWIYDSFKGKRPKQNAVYDMFLDEFFPQHRKSNLTAQDATEIRERMQNLKEYIVKCRSLLQGQWLYEDKQFITGWDKSRLEIILVQLGHTLSIPLLLAASELEVKKFSEIVQMIERMFFRYKLICNEHITPLKNIYSKATVNIRKDPESYDVNNLREELGKLLNSKAHDKNFETSLLNFEYQESGVSNKPLKYFLMTIEYYYQWYKQGAIGNPSCIDKSRIYNFASTSIEHIYPRNPDDSDKDIKIEPFKNSIGNLTIMDGQQNTLGSNHPFINKKNIYQSSSVVLTQEIGHSPDWTIEEVKAHQKKLIDAAITIFRP